MADNAQITPIGKSLSRWGRGVVANGLNVIAKNLPATVAARIGAIVDVNFEVQGVEKPPRVKMPILGSKYFRAPIQPGERGMTLSADAYLGGMSGLGGGVADFTQRANLATLVWTPIGNADWESLDPNTTWIVGGPNGVTIRDASGGSVMSMNATGISMSFGGNTLAINGTGVVINGRIFLDHEHKNVQTGGGVSGGVV